MEKYKNFDLAIYCTVGYLKRVDLNTLKEDIEFFKKHLKISKVYLETHRGQNDIQKEKILMIKELFEKNGIKTSGGITTTISYDNDEYASLRLLNTFCYTNPSYANRLKEIVEFTASIFDEIILDDFYFTACTCPSCIKEKGDLSWEDFRLNLMTKISEEYVVKPAKKINPNINMIIKYPNWNESYQKTGYNPETQSKIFDCVYTGTETRDSYLTQQHLPRYLSYSLMRWFENLKPGKNLGGWFDSFDCIYNLGYYLEQAYLTVFAKAKEVTLFDFNSLRNSVFIPALGHQLDILDKILDNLGNPYGIPVYLPFHSYGEDHIYDYLGMVGIPLEPTPFFPKNSNTVLVTQSSAFDDNIILKLKEHLLMGKNVIMTSGFLKAMTNKGIEDLTSLRFTDKKVASNFFAIKTEGCAFSKYVYSKREILLPVLEHSNNASWQEIVAISGENNFPVLMSDGYGKGKIYTIIIPDNYSDMYSYPSEVLLQIRRLIMQDFDICLEAEEKTALFTYDNDTFIVESFLPYRNEIKVHIKNKDAKLIDMMSNVQLTPSLISQTEAIFTIKLQPSTFRVFKVV